MKILLEKLWKSFCKKIRFSKKKNHIWVHDRISESLLNIFSGITSIEETIVEISGETPGAFPAEIFEKFLEEIPEKSQRKISWKKSAYIPTDAILM